MREAPSSEPPSEEDPGRRASLARAGGVRAAPAGRPEPARTAPCRPSTPSPRGIQECPNRSPSSRAAMSTRPGARMRPRCPGCRTGTARNCRGCDGGSLPAGRGVHAGTPLASPARRSKSKGQSSRPLARRSVTPSWNQRARPTRSRARFRMPSAASKTRSKTPSKGNSTRSSVRDNTRLQHQDQSSKSSSRWRRQCASFGKISRVPRIDASGSRPETP